MQRVMEMAAHYRPAPPLHAEDRVRVMILGPAGEARRLAEPLAPRAEVEVVRSPGGPATAFGGLLRAGEPAADMPAIVRTILGMGPFSRVSELELLDGHRIAVVVAKMAGGSAAYAKIEAARQLGLPVVLLRRPEPPAGPMAASIAEALAWLEPFVEAARGDHDG